MNNELQYFYTVNLGRIGHIALKNYVELRFFKLSTYVLNPVESDNFRELSLAQKSQSTRVLQPIPSKITFFSTMVEWILAINMLFNSVV